MGVMLSIKTKEDVTNLSNDELCKAIISRHQFNNVVKKEFAKRLLRLSLKELYELEKDVTTNQNKYIIKYAINKKEISLLEQHN